MIENLSIAVVIPAYKVAGHIAKVIETLPEMVDRIIVVDDKCPQQSGKIAEEMSKLNSKIEVIFHDKNAGVGGAVISGYLRAIATNCDIVVKVDGDGQMDPSFIPALVKPLVSNKADYAKGNRFSEPGSLKGMPRIRLFGNSVLSFLLKVCSGYWDIMDPTNGFTAISERAIRKLQFKKISKRYFFESDMLIHLNISNCVVRDIAMPAIYGDEKSSLRISNVLLKFPFLLFKRFFKRILYKYFIYDFNMASIYIVTGMPLFLFGSIYGIYRWIYGVVHQEVNSTGTVMLSILPIILGIQFLLQAIQIDINSIPKKKKEDE